MVSQISRLNGATVRINVIEMWRVISITPRETWTKSFDDRHTAGMEMTNQLFSFRWDQECIVQLQYLECGRWVTARFPEGNLTQFFYPKVAPLTTRIRWFLMDKLRSINPDWRGNHALAIASR